MNTCVPQIATEFDDASDLPLVATRLALNSRATEIRGRDESKWALALEVDGNEVRVSGVDEIDGVQVGTSEPPRDIFENLWQQHFALNFGCHLSQNVRTDRIPSGEEI